MYKVVYKFADAQDKNHIYEIGDVFPREGKTVTDKRIAELASAENRTGKVLIEEVAEVEAEVAEAEEVETEPEAEAEVESKPKKIKDK